MHNEESDIDDRWKLLRCGTGRDAGARIESKVSAEAREGFGPRTGIEDGLNCRMYTFGYFIFVFKYEHRNNQVYKQQASFEILPANPAHNNVPIRASEELSYAAVRIILPITENAYIALWSSPVAMDSPVILIHHPISLISHRIS